MKFDKDLRKDFCIAALCHDLGHSAYSHVLESILLPEGLKHHEDCTLLMIMDERTEIHKAIDAAADIESVLHFLTKEHPNAALGALISGNFDVDRCDYLIRDSLMSGVGYGIFDFTWMLHAFTVGINYLQQPVLLLDGPRGLDALRQFLSARRYMHRQVYFHPTIRAAQNLLKSIFERIADLELKGGQKAREDTRALCPPDLVSAVTRSEIALDQFIRTTDIEVNYMVRCFSQRHSDDVLRYLCNLFVRREFPKTVLDSGKMNVPFYREFRISFDRDSDDTGQEDLLAGEPSSVHAVLESLREFVGDILEANSVPRDAAEYLVRYDNPSFRSELPVDLKFSFKGKAVELGDIDPSCVGFDVRHLAEEFAVFRIFVPRTCTEEAAEHLESVFGIAGRDQMGGYHGERIS